MLAVLLDLIRHKNYANSVLLDAISARQEAAEDKELRVLLHHVLLADRFWFFLFLDRPFDVETESQTPNSLDLLRTMFRDTYAHEAEWLAGIRESDLERTVVTPFLPERTFSVAQGMIQVCLHSHGHRSQCAARLRALGGQPPQMDFILWLRDRPAPTWT